jgi:probable rRNA maturation factor
VLSTKKIACEEVSVYLVGKRKIASLHKDFFNDPTPTDCITFPIDAQFLGEIFICPKVAQEYNPKKPYVETALYIIHAILHLLGYDDISENKRKIMHKEQERLLKLATKHQCILEP